MDSDISSTLKALYCQEESIKEFTILCKRQFKWSEQAVWMV